MSESIVYNLYLLTQSLEKNEQKKNSFSVVMFLYSVCGYVYEVCFVPVTRGEAGLPNVKRLKEFGGVSVIVSSNESDVANAASVKNPSRFLWLHVPILLPPFLSLLYHHHLCFLFSVFRCSL